MKLVIEGTAYDITDALQKASLGDLYQLKVTTGIGMKTLKASMAAMGDLEDSMDFMESAPILLALNALVWLCRRRAGESLTIEQANATPFDSLLFVADVEPDAPVEDADPTEALTDSVQGDEPETPPTQT